MICYTDGSAHPNPGPGGYGVVILDNNENLLYTYNRQFDNEVVTNNEMELKAILYCIINYGKLNPIVYSDSAYCVNSLTNWIYNWHKNGWLKGDGKPPENLKLFKAYYELLEQGYHIQLKKVKGHADNKWNILADKLATGEILDEQ